MKAVRSIIHNGNFWHFSARDDRIVITECAGPFSLPVRNIEIPVDIARSFANSIIATAKTIAPELRKKP